MIIRIIIIIKCVPHTYPPCWLLRVERKENEERRWSDERMKKWWRWSDEWKITNFISSWKAHLMRWVLSPLLKAGMLLQVLSDPHCYIDWLISYQNLMTAGYPPLFPFTGVCRRWLHGRHLGLWCPLQGVLPRPQPIQHGHFPFLNRGGTPTVVHQ